MSPMDFEGLKQRATLAGRDNLSIKGSRFLEAMEYARKEAASAWPEGVKTAEIYERAEDMSPDGRLQVLIENDGDAILGIIPGSGTCDRTRILPQVQFCTYAGGGRSPRVRAAILQLAKAIMDDNAERKI